MFTQKLVIPAVIMTASFTAMMTATTWYAAPVAMLCGIALGVAVRELRDDTAVAAVGTWADAVRERAA